MGQSKLEELKFQFTVRGISELYVVLVVNRRECSFYNGSKSTECIKCEFSVILSHATLADSTKGDFKYWFCRKQR